MYHVRLTQSHFPPVAAGSVDTITIGEALGRAVEDAGDVTALKEVTADGEVRRVWSYRELFRDARRLANALLSRHAPGDRIAVWANNVPEWVLLEYAAALAGLPLVTVNPSLQAREVKYVLEQSRSAGLYVVQSFRGNPIARIAADVCREIAAIRSLIDVNDSGALFDGADVERQLPRLQPRDAAQIQYTSGTTGFPKGAVLHHQGLYVNAKLTAERHGMRRGDPFLNFMPMFHTASCALTTLGCLSARATMLIAATFDPAAMMRTIEVERVTGFVAVPTMITALLESQSAQPRDVTCVRGIISGGSMVAPDLVKRAQSVFEATFQIVYGQTETSPVLTLVWTDSANEDVTQTVGQPLPHTEISIREPSTNDIVPVGAPGEICARGYMNMLGYNDNAAATRETIDAEGWLHTGDIGTLDERGFVRITGRVKDMIIRGGENLFPAEIENAMLEHPDLSEVAVVGLPDERFGEIVACFMRASAAKRPSRQELVAFCRQLLSPQKTPAIWIYVDEWPLTGSGKIRKFVLKEMYEAGQFDRQIL